MKRIAFNPSLTMPIIDIIVAIILMAGTGYFWFHTKGEARLAEAHNDLAEAEAQNAAKLQGTLDKQVEAEDELATAQQTREDKAQYVQFLLDRIEIENETIREAKESD
ncbi:hypothetical protein ACFL6M_07010, partial [Candidatus Eisenbacteria bacterium]